MWPFKQKAHPLKDEIKKQVVLTKIRPVKGMTMYEIDCETAEIKEAEIIDRPINGIMHQAVQTKANCLYTMALNVKNAEKKFLRMALEMNQKAPVQSFIDGGIIPSHNYVEPDFEAERAEKIVPLSAIKEPIK